MCPGKTKQALATLALLIWGVISWAIEPAPMPPDFVANADPGTVLGQYPLGTVDKNAAFLHHGKAVRIVKAPNGKEGWVYEVGGKKTGTYRDPTGEERSVREGSSGGGLRTYTLVFDDAGKVIDVIYNETGRHDGLTALQMQSKGLGTGTPGGDRE